MAFVCQDMVSYGHACSRENFPVERAGVASKCLPGRNKEIRAYPELEGWRDVGIKFNPAEG